MSSPTYADSWRLNYRNINQWDSEMLSRAVGGVTLMQSICFEQAVHMGWYEDSETGESLIGKRNAGEQLMLMVSELAEAMEGHRKSLPDTHLEHRPMVEVELADTIIRILDFAGAHKLDVAGAMEEKLRYNFQRADHQMENRKASGGKKY